MLTNEERKKRNEAIAFQRSKGKSKSELGEMFGLAKPGIVFVMKAFPKEEEMGKALVEARMERIHEHLRKKRESKRKKAEKGKLRFKNLRKKILKIDVKTEGSTPQAVIATKLKCSQGFVSDVLVEAGRRRTPRKRFW